MASPTLTVVELIAEKEKVDPVELQPPLHSVVDTEALDRMIESMSGDGRVEFQYCDYQVTVFGSGEVKIARITNNQSSSLVG
nr:HalOD1 output domain-containing protein [Natrarchaeobius chitinivorans]